MIRSALLVASVVCAMATTVQARQTISIVADEWAPFGGAELPNGGISLDVISTVLNRAGYDVTTEVLPWERALDGAKSGVYDVIGNLYKDPEREEYLAFSDPFYETEVRFVRRRGTNHSYTNLDSLRPYSIAVGAGYLYEDDFDRADFLQKRVVTTVIQGVRMVASGRVDLTLDSIEVLDYVIRNEDPGLAERVEYLPNRLAARAIHMGVRTDLENRDALVASFNRVLAEMRTDGTLTELLRKHRN